MGDILNFNFNIPKIRRTDTKDNLRSVSVKGRDAQDVIDVVQRSYMDRNYRHGFEMESVQLVENKTLEEAYRTKKAELKEDGRHSRELVEQYAFLMHRDAKIALKVAQEGLKTREISFNSLGNSKFGVYVCKHADVQLRLFEAMPQDTCQLMVFKVFLGRSKAMALQPSMMIEPTPNYDCHVNQQKASPLDSLGVQNSRTQIYLYEYDEDCEPVQRPRQCLPYAVVTFKKNRDTQQGAPVGSVINSYNRPIKTSEPKAPETVGGIDTTIPILINRTKNDLPPQKIQPSASAHKDPRRHLSKQERRELFERQHAEMLRQQSLQDKRSSSDLNDPVVYNPSMSTSTAFTKVQTRHDPRLKNASASLGPPQTANVIKPRSPSRGVDQRRPSNEGKHPGIGYQKQLNVNIPRQRYLSGESSSPDGDTSISDALTDLIVKNQFKTDSLGRPILACPSPNKIEEEKQQSLSQKFAEEIQKHLQMTGTVDLPQTSMQNDTSQVKGVQNIVLGQPGHVIETSNSALKEDYTPQPMDIDVSEPNEDKLEKGVDFEFDSKISELLNEANTGSLGLDVAKENEIQKVVCDVSQKLKEKELTPKATNVANIVDDEDDDDDKLVIAEMDVESKKREIIEKRRTSKDDLIETDLLTFVSREDIKKRDPTKEVKEKIDDKNKLDSVTAKKAEIVVVKEETMNKNEQLKMQREKVLKEVQSMLERSKEKSVDKKAEVLNSASIVKEPVSLSETTAKVEENKSEPKTDEIKETPKNNDEKNVSDEIIDYELSTFSSDSDMESVQSFGEDRSSSPILYYDSPMKFDHKGPYDVQTSPQKFESKSDTWVSHSRNLYDAYAPQNVQQESKPRNEPVQSQWNYPPEQNVGQRPIDNFHVNRPPAPHPQFYGQAPYPPHRGDPQNMHPRFPFKSMSDTDAYNLQHQQYSSQPPFPQDVDYRQKPQERPSMDFLNVQNLDNRQKAFIDVNPETGDVDYRRLNPVKPVQIPPPTNQGNMWNQPQGNQDSRSQPQGSHDMRNQFLHNQNAAPLMYPQQNTNINPQSFNQHFSPTGNVPPVPHSNSSMLSPTGTANWGKTETIGVGVTSPSKDKKITYKDYKARRKNSPIRNDSPKSEAGFNMLQTAGLDLNNLKNILETVNVVSALKKDFPDSEKSDDQKMQPQKYIDDVTKRSIDGEMKHSGELSFLNQMKDDNGLFDCYGKDTIPGLGGDYRPTITSGNISISSILGTQIDMTKFENKDVDMRVPQPQIKIVGDEEKRYVRPYPWEYLHVNTEGDNADQVSMSIDSASGKTSPLSSCSSPRGKTKKTKVKKEMMGYVKRRRRKKGGKRNSNDNTSDITGETGSIGSSDWKSSVEELARVRVMSLEEVGLNHWTDAISHPKFQPRVHLKRQKEAEIGALKIAERNELKSEKEALDSQPAERNSMVRQWVETSHKKIKLITLKRTKDEDTESVKSGKSGSAIIDDVDIDLVEKQIAQDMAKSDDAMSISSSSDVVYQYQKPGPKCSKKPRLVTGEQTIPVLNKRKIPTTGNAQQLITSANQYSVNQGSSQIQSSQGHIPVISAPYPVTSSYPGGPLTPTQPSYTTLPPYPVQGQHLYPQSQRPSLMPPSQGQAMLTQGVNQHPVQPLGLSNIGSNVPYPNQVGQRFPNPPYPIHNNVPPYRPSNFPPPHASAQPGQTGQGTQQQQRPLEFNHPPPNLNQPPPGMFGTPQDINNVFQPPTQQTSSTCISSSSQQSQNVQSHLPTNPSQMNVNYASIANAISMSESKNITAPPSHPAGTPHRLAAPIIRPIVAQASFLNRPPKTTLYPATDIPVSTTSQAQTILAVTTTTVTSSGEVTPTGTKKPSDVADWFADKLKPKIAEGSSKETSNSPFDKSVVKPKEGSLREELEKLRRSKMEEQKKPESISPPKSTEISPKPKEKRKKKDSVGNDIFEDSENESKSSHSPSSSRGNSRKRSPNSRGKRYSPGGRRRDSFSPGRRFSYERSYSPISPDGKSKNIGHKRRRSSRSPDIRRRISRSPDSRKRSSRSPDIRRRSSRSPDTRRRSSRSPDTRRRLSRSPGRRRRSSRSPDSLRRSSRSPDSKRKTSGSPGSKRRTSRSPGSKRRTSRSPDSKRRSRSPESKRRTSRSPDSKRRTSRSPDSRKRSRSPNFRRSSRSPDSRRRMIRSPDSSRRSRSPYSRRRSSRSPDFRRRSSRSPNSRKISSRSPSIRGRRFSRSPDTRRRLSRSPERFRRMRTPENRRKSSHSPERRTNQFNVSPDKRKPSSDFQRSSKDLSLGYDFPTLTNVPTQNSSKLTDSPKTKVANQKDISPQGKDFRETTKTDIMPQQNRPSESLNVTEKSKNSGTKLVIEKLEIDKQEQALIEETKNMQTIDNKELPILNQDSATEHQSSDLSDNPIRKPILRMPINNKWTKSNFTEYTVEQINEEDRKLEEELKNLEEQKKILEEKQREEERKLEDERIREELRELEKQKKFAEELLELQKKEEELARLEKEKKVTEELIELEKLRKTTEDSERNKKNIQDKKYEGSMTKTKSSKLVKDSDVEMISEDDEKITDELDDLALQKEELQKALADLENVDKNSDCCEVDSSELEDGEIEDDSDEEKKEEKSKKDGDERNPIVIGSEKDLKEWSRRSRSRERYSGSRRRRSSSRQRVGSSEAEYYKEEYDRRPSTGHSDDKIQHAKDIGNAWGAMISHKDNRVERIKGDPFFKRKKDGKESENEDVEDKVKKKTLSAKIRTSELITAYDLEEEHLRTKPKQELVTFADWLKIEYKLDDLGVVKHEKYITCVDLYTRIDENSKNKRKTLKKRLRAEMQVAQEKMKLDEMEKQNPSSSSDKPVRSVVISGVKERMESSKDNKEDSDKRIVCDSGVHQLNEIEHLQEPFNIPRQKLVSELEMVRSTLKSSWKAPKTKPADNSKNESLGFGEGDYDHEFLMRHDLQQLEAELLMRINHFEFHGVPNRRVPDILLTKKEKNSHFSEEGLFLVLTASISHKAYQNLLSLKRKLESTQQLISSLNPTTHGTQIIKHLQDVEVLHQSRKAIMLTIAGYLTKKRFSKLSTRLKYYKRCIQYIKDLWKTELMYLTTIVADAEVHLKLGERLLQEQESGIKAPVSANKDLLSIRVPVTNIPPAPSNWKNIISEAAASSVPPITGPCVSKAAEGNQISNSHSNTRNVQLKDEYIPIPRNIDVCHSSTSRNTIPSHTTQTAIRNPALHTQPSSVQSNLRHVPLLSTPDASKPVNSVPYNNANTQNINRGQNVNSYGNFNQNNIRDTQSGGIQNSGIDNQFRQVPHVQGESAALKSPYTLPPPRYLPQERPPPNWEQRGHPPGQPARSQHDRKLESDLITVRDKLLHLSQQLRHDDSVRMSVQSVLLSVTEALNLLREESSNLPKVKEIILECLSRYNAVKELMEGTNR